MIVYSGSTFADEDRKDAVFFSVPCGRNQEALLRGVPKRGRDEENDDDLDELFGEANADEANGALFLKSGVFAPRAIQREGKSVSFPFSPPLCLIVLVKGCAASLFWCPILTVLSWDIFLWTRELSFTI